MKAHAASRIPLQFSVVLPLALVVGLLLSASPGASESSPPSPSASFQEVRHPVGAGEDLHLLAAYYYGDARQWKRIYQANRGRIKNPNRIYPGQVLRIQVPPHWEPPMPFSEWLAGTKGDTPAPSATKPPHRKPAEEETPQGSAQQ